MTKDSADENEEFYVAARILEASAKSESGASTARAAVYARAAERAKKGHDADGILNSLSDDAEAEAERAVENLRLAAKEIDEEERAAITEKVNDAVVARLRSEYD